MEEQIRNWIDSNGNLLDGIELLRRSGVNVSRFEAFAKKAFVQPSVKEEIRKKLIGLAPNNAQVKSAPKIILFIQVTTQKVAPPEIDSLHQTGKRLLKKRAQLHAHLCVAPTDQLRYELAKELDELQPNIDRTYETIHLWERTGDLPNTEAEEVKTATVKKMMQRSSLIVRISQLRGKEKKETDKLKLAQIKSELSEKEADLVKLNADLGL